MLEGDGAPVLDVQQHLLELEGYDGGFGSSFPQAGCGDGDACFDTEHWLDLVFGRSDTTMAVLSAIPVLGDPDPLSAEVMDAARRAADELCGDGRVLVQGHAQPNVGELEAALDAMRAEAERYPIAAWKSYTHVGRPWRLDDDTGDAFLALVEEIGPPIVCVHKGLGGDPSDVGPAAAAHPDVAFVAYHSGYETSTVEGAYTPGSPNGGVDRLLESVRRGGDPAGRQRVRRARHHLAHADDRSRPGRPPPGQADRRARSGQRALGHRLDLVRLTAGPDRRLPHLRDHRRGAGALRLRAAHERGEGRDPRRQRRPPLRRRPGHRAVLVHGGRSRRPPRRPARTPTASSAPRPRRDARRVFAADHPWFWVSPRRSPAAGSWRS